jgi:molecular chaperone HscA
MKAGLPKIEVSFKIDEDGLISIKAEEKSSQNFEELNVKADYGISQEDIDNMLKNAYINAKEDHNEKILLQAEMKGRDLIKSINILLSECSDNLDQDNLNKIKGSIKDLDSAIIEKNANIILDKIKQLKDLSNFLVEMKLTNDILSVIKGKNIKDI